MRAPVSKERQREYQRRYRARHPERVLQHSLRSNARAYLSGRNLVDSFKARPCLDCGGSFDSVCMHFDHVPERGEKSFNIAHGVGRFKPEIIAAEIAKCDVVCANCHAIRTKSRRAEKYSKSRKARIALVGGL